MSWTGVRRAIVASCFLATWLLLGPMTALARGGGGASPSLPVDTPAPTKEVLVAGESLHYDVYFGPFRVGTAELTLAREEDGPYAGLWHARLHVEGRALWYSLDDTMESWFEPDSFRSHHFRQRTVERHGPPRLRSYEIDPDQDRYRKDDEPWKPTVEDPVDEVAFLYLLRTMDLPTGASLELERYFKPEHNPVRLRVLPVRKVKVPAGSFRCIELKPVVPRRGLFKEGGDASVFVSDDERRLVVLVTTKAYVGTLRLKLRSIEGRP